MVDRSSVYSVDTVPDPGARSARIRAVSQHPVQVPLGHELLVGRDIRTCPSLSWPGRVAICGDFDGGVELLRRFLRVVAAGEIARRELFQHTVATIETVLTDPTRQGRYLLLEPVQVIARQVTAVDRAAVLAYESRVNEMAAVEIPDSVARAEAAIAGHEGPWLAKVRQAWRRHFDSLYGDGQHRPLPRDEFAAPTATRAGAVAASAATATLVLTNP